MIICSPTMLIIDIFSIFASSFFFIYCFHISSDKSNWINGQQIFTFWYLHMCVHI